MIKYDWTHLGISKKRKTYHNRRALQNVQGSFYSATQIIPLFYDYLQKYKQCTQKSVKWCVACEKSQVMANLKMQQNCRASAVTQNHLHFLFLDVFAPEAAQILICLILATFPLTCITPPRKTKGKGSGIIHRKVHVGGKTFITCLC